jgi:hypothetical protein
MSIVCLSRKKILGTPLAVCGAEKVEELLFRFYNTIYSSSSGFLQFDSIINFYLSTHAWWILKFYFLSGGGKYLSCA